MAKTKGYLRKYRRHRKNVAFDAETRAVLNKMRTTSDIKDILPKGRAPKGKGAEYAARRWIYNTLITTSRQLNRINTTLANSRSQKKFKRRDSNARDRRQLLKKFQRTAKSIANAPGDWAYKKSLILSIKKTMVGALAV